MAAKEVSDGREGFHRTFVGGILPLALEVILQFLRAHVRNLDETEIWQATESGGFQITHPVATDRETHVGLAGAHPNFADEDVLDFLFGGTGDGHGLGWSLAVIGCQALRSICHPHRLRWNGFARRTEFTLVPGASQPQMGSDCFCWSTMWSVMMAGSFNSAWRPGTNASAIAERSADVFMRRLGERERGEKGSF